MNTLILPASYESVVKILLKVFSNIFEAQVPWHRVLQWAREKTLYKATVDSQSSVKCSASFNGLPQESGDRAVENKYSLIVCLAGAKKQVPPASVLSTEVRKVMK